MPIKLTDLIARVPAEVEAKVRRVRDRARPAVQEALRAECRLVFRAPEESEQNRPGAQVPIEVAPGYPVNLEQITFQDDLERIMLLGRYRALLEGARNASGLLRLRDELLRRPEPEKLDFGKQLGLAIGLKLGRSSPQGLDQHDPLKTVLSVSEGFLAVYEYDARGLFPDEQAVNRATIRLYWGVSAWCLLTN